MTDHRLIPIFRYVNPRELDMLDPEIYAAVCHAMKLRMRRTAWPEVRALLMAKWRLEIQMHEWCDPEPWQWAWRVPMKRKGAKGRRYASTTQAYNALIRQTGKG